MLPSQPAAPKGLPQSNTASKVDDCREAIRETISNVWVSISHAVRIYASDERELEEDRWSKEQHLEAAVSVYFEGLVKGAEQLIVAGIYGEIPTFEQVRLTSPRFFYN